MPFTKYYLRRPSRRVSRGLNRRFVRDIGFTLTELAITMLVLGVLASVAIPSFLGSRNNSYDKEAQASIEVVLRAARLLYQSQGDFSTGSSAQCGDSTILAADLQKLEPNVDVVASSVSSTNSRVVSVQSVQTWNSNGELLGCQGFYAVALSSSGSCWAARLIVEGKFLAAGSVSPVAVAQQTNTSNKAVTTWTALPVNGVAFGVLKPQTSAADGNNTNNLASIKTFCKAKEQSTGSPTVDGLIIAPSQFYATWRDVAPGGTASNVNGVAAIAAATPAFTLSSSSESVVQSVSMSGYTITSTGAAIASYAISPSAPTGTSFDTSTGLLSGTPTAVQSATAYTITARSAAGYTSTALFTLTVTAATPGTASITRRVYGDNQVTVTVAAGTGGTPTSYTVSASPQVSGVTRTCTVTGASGSCTVTGLTNGTAYTFSATATNAAGTSTASSATYPTTPYSAATAAAAAGTGSIWTLRTGTGLGTWEALAYGDNKWIAIGRNASAMTSTDGITWNALTVENRTWRALAYGNGRWVAAGERYYNDSLMMYSTNNGTTWTERNGVAVAKDWSSLTYGNGLFVAVSDEIAGTTTQQVSTSPDGVTWTTRSSSTAAAWKSVAYDAVNGLFVAVAEDRVMTSTDGTSWTTQTVPSGRWTDVAYGNGLWVATQSLYDNETTQNRIVTSPDGVNWTARSTLTSTDRAWSGIVYGNNTWVAISQNFTGVMTSPDAINWTEQYSADTAQQWVVIGYGGGKLVAIGRAGRYVEGVFDGSNLVMTG